MNRVRPLLRVEVGSLAEARAALATARVVGWALCLESPAAAAGWHGIGWWHGVVEQIIAEADDVRVEAVLDCGTAPGLALAALRAGCRAVRLESGPAATAAVTAIAAELGGKVLPPWPDRDQFAAGAGVAGVAGAAGALVSALG
ncbi:hypothetical protein [Magnetospirillum molischianum]|uniref:Uncharacterized protein n=1 Tax=Magnetospirillum molischianum DSM 120 TaxID=1150626 RepID=H8FSF4_MAGML|nr:hypothetical protein [Magnetospirillum molischianum]CCG41292.1 conserved exported hypothetical protein [Magnetospirillum molischianum DSM 120]